MSTQTATPTWIEDMGFATDPIPASAFTPDSDLSEWEPAPATVGSEPHYITQNCCPACEAIIARADAEIAMKDYCKGYISETEMRAAQAYARYCATMAAEQAA